jgi:hypothetical protein
MNRILCGYWTCLLLLCCTVSGAPAGKTRNVLLVMTDGLRWQEVFQGADAALLNKEAGVKDIEGTRQRFWRESAVDRREALLPFLWKMVGK